jgi:hypothetical protein
MHVLGFLHEQLQPEAKKVNPLCIEKLEAGINGFKGISPLKITVYDPESIMNYCDFPDRWSQPPTLSF